MQLLSCYRDLPRRCLTEQERETWKKRLLLALQWWASWSNVFEVYETSGKENREKSLTTHQPKLQERALVIGLRKFPILSPMRAPTALLFGCSSAAFCRWATRVIWELPIHFGNLWEAGAWVRNDNNKIAFSPLARSCSKITTPTSASCIKFSC